VDARTYEYVDYYEQPSGSLASGRLEGSI